MTVDEFQEFIIRVGPSLLELLFYLFALIVLVSLIFAILRTPKEIRKNRAVLSQILQTLRTRDEP